MAGIVLSRVCTIIRPLRTRSRTIDSCRHVSTFNYFSFDSVRFVEPRRGAARPNRLTNRCYRARTRLTLIITHGPEREGKKDRIEKHGRVHTARSLAPIPLYRKQRRCIARYQLRPFDFPIRRAAQSEQFAFATGRRGPWTC